ncbi:hypothetical protein IWZ03DRAFT_177980 [Phyllosticta citriasiana]|uniref:Uncharacterized protein n=1 Tax=Phyllosticta citriasiana TaxID=595635 RepID=A0ABR1KPP2_9PEZI
MCPTVWSSLYPCRVALAKSSPPARCKPDQHDLTVPIVMKSWLSRYMYHVLCLDSPPPACIRAVAQRSKRNPSPPFFCSPHSHPSPPPGYHVHIQVHLRYRHLVPLQWNQIQEKTAAHFRDARSSRNHTILGFLSSCISSRSRSIRCAASLLSSTLLMLPVRMCIDIISRFAYSGKGSSPAPIVTYLRSGVSDDDLGAGCIFRQSRSRLGRSTASPISGRDPSQQLLQSSS